MPIDKSGGPRVAMISDSLEGGAGRAALRLFRGLRREGHAVDLFYFYGNCLDDGSYCLDGRSKRPPLERALKNISLGAANSLRRKRHLASLRDALTRKPYDLLHVHNLHACGVDAAGLSNLAGAKPVLWTLHDEFAFRGRPFPTEDELAPPPVVPELFEIEGLAFTGPSRWICRQAEEATEGRIPVNFVPLGLDPEEFTAIDPAECRHALGMESSALWLGFGGGTDPRKGGDLLLEASRFLDPSLDVRLLAWGRGLPSVSHGFREIKQLPYFDDSRALNRAYSACDLMVLPSRQDNAPLVVLESFACGTPVAASVRGGSSEFIEEGANGCSIPVEPEAMAAKLTTMLKNPELASMRGQARAQFAANHTSVLEAQRVRSLYKFMTGSKA